MINIDIFEYIHNFILSRFQCCKPSEEFINPVDDEQEPAIDVGQDDNSLDLPNLAPAALTPDTIAPATPAPTTLAPSLVDQTNNSTNYAPSSPLAHNNHVGQAILK